jgi:hypothetical protein
LVQIPLSPSEHRLEDQPLGSLQIRGAAVFLPAGIFAAITGW